MVTIASWMDPENFMAYELLSILKFAVRVSPALIKTKKSHSLTFQLATALVLLIHGLFEQLQHHLGEKDSLIPKSTSTTMC